jgi:outer membrane protein assembly factor BamB/tetratricopeptide (TPR) repeat protein
MALKGDLTSVGLADVFQMLAMNRKEGLLSLRGTDSFKALYFGQQGVTLYYNEYGFLDRLLDALVRKGILSLDVLQALRKESGGDPIGTVESVLGSGVVPEETFLDCFREEMEEGIYDLFLWENVHWEFFEGAQALQGHDGVINENFFLNPDSLVMEAARRLDEWSVIRNQVPDNTEIFTRCEGSDPQSIELESERQPLFEIIDGKRNVERLIEISGISPFHVAKALSELSLSGLIEPLADERLIENSDECYSEARYEDAINLLERSIQEEIGLPEAHLKVAKVYEIRHELALANWHLKSYAADLVEEGRIDEAVTVLEECLRNIPTDLDAWERLVQGLVHQSNPSQDPHEVGRNLIDVYLELDETDRARKVLEGLLKVRPEDIELKKTLVAVHMKAGDTKRVMELYEAIAADLVSEKDPIGAVRYLQKILMLDRSRGDISDRIKQLYVLDEKTRARQRSLFLTIASIICFGVVGTLYYIYDQNVSSRFDRLDPSPYLKETDYEGALAMYKEFQDQNPLSWSARQKVAPAMAGLMSKRDIHLAELERVKRNDDRIASQKRREYQILYEEYQAKFDEEEDAEKALQRLVKVISLVEDAAQEQDQRFRADRKLDAEEKQLRDLLAEAGRIESRVKSSRRKGEYETERKLALLLQSKYIFTPSARRTEIPIMLTSEPRGATVEIDGVLLESNGKPARTPTIVRVLPGKKSKVRLLKRGYEAIPLLIAAMGKAPVNRVLRVRPTRSLSLPDDAVTGMALGKSTGMVGLRSGKVVGVDLETAKKKFTIKLPGLEEVRQSPILSDDVGVVISTEGILRGLSLETGRFLWENSLAKGGSTPLLDTPRGIVLADADGVLRCFDPTDGEMQWERPTDILPGTSKPRIFGGKIWYAGSGGRMIAVDIRKGSITTSLRISTGIQDGPVLSAGILAVYCTDGNLRGIDTKAKEVWSLDVGDSHQRGALLADDDGIVFANAKGQVSRIHPKTGKLLIEKTLPGTFSGEATKAGNILFFLSQKGEATYITSLEGPDLEVRWEYRLEKGVRGQPSVHGKTLVIVGGDRKARFLK